MNTKRALKFTLKHCARLVPLRADAGRRILTYHSIGDRDHEMNVSPENFRQQMLWLAEHHPVVPVEDLLNGAPGVALTFDDGYRDNLTNAARILNELNLRATLFLVTGRTGHYLDHDAPTGSSRIMTWEEARAWQDHGLDIGGHTRTHPRLAALNDSSIESEIQGCFDDLARELGPRSRGFAYPFGAAIDYDARAIEAVKTAGFTYALSNRYGPAQTPIDRWTTRRCWIDATDTLGTFQAKVNGRLDALAWLESIPAIRARRTLNRFLDPPRATAFQPHSTDAP